MNRLRLWGYVVLLLVVGLANLYFVSGWIGARSLASLDRDLRSAATLLEGRTRLLAADAGALAETASRSPAVVAGLAEAQLDPLSAADEAIRPAAEAMKVDAKALLVGVAGTRGTFARAAGQQVALPDGAPFLADPQRGVRRDGFARLADRVWSVAGVPAGRGGVAMIGLPVDAGFVSGVRAASGVDATLLLDGKPVATSIRPEAPRELAAAAAQPPRRVTDVGHLGAVKGYLPFPAMPLLFTSAPAARAYTVPLDGAPGVVVVLSAAAEPHFVGLATYQAASLLALAVLLVVGVVLGLLMRDEGGRAIPRELLQAADRVNRGDFRARAPTLAGSAGVLASALNRAAEAAEAARSGPSAAAEPATAAEVTETGTQPIFAPLPPEPSPAPAPAEVEEPEPTAAWPSPGEAPAPSAIAGASVEPVPAEPVAAPFVPEPAAAAPEPISPAPEPATSAAPEPEPIPPVPEPAPGVIPELPPPPPEAPAEPPPPAAASPEPEAAPASASSAEEEESHWRMVFDDFLRVRGETGEGAQPVSFERFRTRLQKNRDQLVEKYACRTVRFQVYVKEGKAAVRATPVR